MSFEYDHQGMRVAATVNGQETRYLLDTTQQTYAQVIEEYLANGTLSRSYTYGRDLLSQDDTSARSYYQVDGLGSTRQLTDASGNVSLSYDYQAFGELLQKVGSGENRYLFAGEQFEESVDLTYLRARYYDMGAGRFASIDPFEGDPHIPISLHDYSYAVNNPPLYSDPSGRVAILETALRLTVMLVTLELADKAVPLVANFVYNCYAMDGKFVEARQMKYTTYVKGNLLALSVLIGIASVPLGILGLLGGALFGDGPISAVSEWGGRPSLSDNYSKNLTSCFLKLFSISKG
jgi:RHS repeat-associated protein